MAELTPQRRQILRTLDKRDRLGNRAVYDKLVSECGLDEHDALYLVGCINSSEDNAIGAWFRGFVRAVNEGVENG